MDGHQLTWPPHVIVVNPSVLSMHFLVQEVIFHATIHHNEIRDITATLLTEVCHDVYVEPDLQPVAPAQLSRASANQEDGARLECGC